MFSIKKNKKEEKQISKYDFKHNLKSSAKKISTLFKVYYGSLFATTILYTMSIFIKNNAFDDFSRNIFQILLVSSYIYVFIAASAIFLMYKTYKKNKINLHNLNNNEILEIYDNPNYGFFKKIIYQNLQDNLSNKKTINYEKTMVLLCFLS